MLAKTSIKKIFNSTSNDKFSVSYRNDFNWDEVFFNCSPQVVFYRSHYIEFAIECLRGNDIICIDFSLGIKLDRKIIALFRRDQGQPSWFFYIIHGVFDVCRSYLSI